MAGVGVAAFFLLAGGLVGGGLRSENWRASCMAGVGVAAFFLLAGGLVGGGLRSENWRVSSMAPQLYKHIVCCARSRTQKTLLKEEWSP